MPTDAAAHATALAQELLGQSFDQLCVGAGDVQLRFTHSTVSLWSTIGVPTGDEVSSSRTPSTGLLCSCRY